MTPPQLLQALQARGLAGTPAEGSANTATAPATAPTAEGVSPAPATPTPHDRPWYIAALLGVSGWFAGIFLLVFIAILVQPDSAGKAGVTGALLLGAAWAMFKADPEGVFLAQFAFALSIAAQCLLLFAIGSNFHSAAPVVATALALQLALTLLIPNRLHCTISAVFATIVWALTLRFTLFGDIEYGYRLTEHASSPADALMGWLLAWLPVAAALWALIRREPAWMARGWQAVLRPVMNGLVIGLALGTLVSRPFESFYWFGSGSAQAGWLALWPLLSALGALGGIAAAFALRSRALMGACIVAALLHLSQFYYELGTSLLLKSLLMLAMGGAMLLAAKALTHEGSKA
ncbi:MAG TPA: DUF4401 domain-containing protein [Ideonella sp.]|nr:DUF4401 domain-containing protein [Ideonella sp.]